MLTRLARLRLTMLARIVLLAELADIHIGLARLRLTRLARILLLHLLLADIHLVLDVLGE